MQPHLSTRQYARIVHAWVESAGLDSAAYGTHSMRRTKAAQIYKKTGNRRAVQLLLGHTKLESTVRDLGIEVYDVLSISALCVIDRDRQSTLIDDRGGIDLRPRRPLSSRPGSRLSGRCLAAGETG